MAVERIYYDEIQKLEQEIKQLKEELGDEKYICKVATDEVKQLKQKLEETKEFLGKHSEICLEMKLMGYPKILESKG